ncbi:hypothetical protein HQ487_05515 [Candidatus Uhrbacteria bacterium]|nr:hypothetical protein [Candidatus Uhrbacteria bacterium]
MNQEIEIRKTWKVKLVLSTLIIATVGILYIYLLFVGMQKELTTLEQIQDVTIQYTEVVNVLEMEKLRCNDFIVNASGNFAEFEYCKGFLVWYDTNIDSLVSL